MEYERLATWEGESDWDPDAPINKIEFDPPEALRKVVEKYSFSMRKWADVPEEPEGREPARFFRRENGIPFNGDDGVKCGLVCVTPPRGTGRYLVREDDFPYVLTQVLAPFAELVATGSHLQVFEVTTRFLQRGHPTNISELFYTYEGLTFAE